MSKFYVGEGVENREIFSQFDKELAGTFKGRNGFREMQANVGKLDKGRNLLKKNKRVWLKWNGCN